MSHDRQESYEFGEFRFDSATKTLRRSGILVQLPPKALELLGVILENGDEVVSKQELFDRVWPGTFVEDGVLTQNIYTLRKTLGEIDGRQPIENVPRRGYRFSVPLRIIDSDGNPTTAEPESSSDRSKNRSGSLRRAVILIAAASVAIAGLGLFVFRRPIRSFFRRPIEGTAFRKVTDSGQVRSPSISRDGEFMTYVRGRTLNLKDLNSDREIPLDVPGIAEFGAPAFSADGNWIYFRDSQILRRNASIKRVSRLGGEAFTVADDVWLGFGLSPDGSQIAFIRKSDDSRRQNLIVRNLSTGAERVVLTRDFPEFFYYRATLAWSPDSGKIAFIANAASERSTRLFIAEVADGQTREIPVSRLRQFESVAWSADGSSLLVSAADLGRKFHLWKVEVPDGDAQRITSGLDNFGAISTSADGKRMIAVRTVESSNLWVAPATDPANLAQKSSGNSNNFGQTSLSFAGSGRIIYSAADEASEFSNLWSLDLNSGARSPLTASTRFHSDFATVSTDGETVYFNSNPERSIGVWKMASEGGKVEAVSNSSDGLRLFPAVSPDGRFVYFIFRSREKSAIRKFDLTTRQELNIALGDSVVPASFLAISPDGARLAFLDIGTNAEDAGPSESTASIAIVEIDGSSPTRILKVPSAGGVARFSPDGNSIDFLSVDDGGSRILRLALAGGEPTTVLELRKERIFNFAWSRDGSLLAVSRGSESRDAVLITGFE